MGDYFRATDKKYMTRELYVLAVVQPEKADHAPSSAVTRFCVAMGRIDNILRILQMHQVTSRPESSHMKLGSW